MQAIIVCAFDKEDLRFYLCQVSVEEFLDADECPYKASDVTQLLSKNILKIKNNSISPKVGYFSSMMDVLEVINKYGISLKEEYHFVLVN